MRGGLHYVDLRYKGIKIQQGWRYLVYKTFLVLYLLALLGFFAFFCSRLHWNLLNWSFWQTLDWGSFGAVLALAGAIAGGVVGVFALFGFPFWDYLANLQRLCRLIYSYPLYITNDIVTPNMFKEEATRVKREIAYFASLYYRERKGVVEITVKLDGSKFHKAGEFDRLQDILEDVYSLDVVDKEERKGYLTYRLEPDVAWKRLKIENLEVTGYTIPLMAEIEWNIAKVPHALITGGTGGGKTFFLHTLIRAFLLMKAELYIGNPKCSALADYHMILPHVATSTAGILNNLEACVKKMNDRYQEIKEREDYLSGQDFTHYDLPPIVFMLDEYLAFEAFLKRDEKADFKAKLGQLIQKGREAGVFVILATQRADASALDGGMRDQLGLRVTLGQMSKDGYRMTFGQTEQTLKNKGVRGRGYVYLDGYTYIREFYAPLVPQGYRFIEEAGKLLGVELCALTLKGGRASTESIDQEAAGGGEYILKEQIYEKG